MNAEGKKAHTKWSDLLPPEDFFCKRGHIGKLRLVFESRQTIGADHAIDLFLRLSLGFGVHQHGKEEGQ